MVEICFFDEILNVNRLVHVDVKMTIVMSDVGEFNSKEMGYFTLEINFV